MHTYEIGCENKLLVIVYKYIVVKVKITNKPRNVVYVKADNVKLEKFYCLVLYSVKV